MRVGFRIKRYSNENVTKSSCYDAKIISVVHRSPLIGVIAHSNVDDTDSDNDFGTQKELMIYKVRTRAR